VRASHQPKFKKTRIAPTPSGFLHLGNVLSFSITAELARRSGAKILLRIDDIDHVRASAEYIQDIFDTLNFLEIEWDEGPRDVVDFEAEWSQRHRTRLYDEAIEQLHAEGLIFACRCSRKQLNDPAAKCNCKGRQVALDTPDVSWRLDTSAAGAMRIKTYTGEVIETMLPAGMENFVVKRRDGLPAYQLTSVIDDLHYGTDLVIRGQDLWESTIAQHILAAALGREEFKKITFYHHPLLMEVNGGKLSKSAGAASVRYLRGEGKTAANIFTEIAEMCGLDRNIRDWGELAGPFV